jgi:hypothetical protein
MPQLAASLRLDGRYGLRSLRRRWLIQIAAAAIAVLPLWTAPATAAERPRDPSRLWNEFPLNTPPRQTTAAESKAAQPVGARERTPTPEPAALPTDLAATGLWLLLAPAGVLAVLTVAVFVRARARRRALPGPERGAAAGPEHLLFVPTDESYVLVEAKGEPPNVGTWLSRNLSREHVFLVQKVGPSPLPDDSRRCAYLERW